MRYVLDSGVALKWVLPEADSDRALRLRDEYSNGLHELLAPDIFPSEIGNGLASGERPKRIGTGESAIFLNDLLSAAPALHHSSPLLIRAVEARLLKLLGTFPFPQSPSREFPESPSRDRVAKEAEAFLAIGAIPGG